MYTHILTYVYTYIYANAYIYQDGWWEITTEDGIWKIDDGAIMINDRNLIMKMSGRLNTLWNTNDEG